MKSRRRIRDLPGRGRQFSGAVQPRACRPQAARSDGTPSDAAASDIFFECVNAANGRRLYAT